MVVRKAAWGFINPTSVTPMAIVLSSSPRNRCYFVELNLCFAMFLAIPAEGYQNTGSTTIIVLFLYRKNVRGSWTVLSNYDAIGGVSGAFLVHQKQPPAVFRTPMHVSVLNLAAEMTAAQERDEHKDG
jgi:hypothetical protein